MLLELGDHRFDIATRALVIGVLDRRPDAFFDGGNRIKHAALDDLLARVDRLVAEGADSIDIGGIGLGPGDEVGVDEELERVVPAVAALADRFDVPIAVDTFRAAVAEECFKAGASIGNDSSGFADPEYLHVAAEAGASVVAGHVRTAPRLADPEPVYGNVVSDVVDFLSERAAWAEAAGIRRSQILVDAAIAVGKTAAMSTELLFETGRLADLGYPTVLSASHTCFLGAIAGPRADVGNHSSAIHAAHVVGIMQGARVLRAADVKGARRVADTVSELLERRGVEAPAAVRR